MLVKHTRTFAIFFFCRPVLRKLTIFSDQGHQENHCWLLLGTSGSSAGTMLQQRPLPVSVNYSFDSYGGSLSPHEIIGIWFLIQAVHVHSQYAKSYKEKKECGTVYDIMSNDWNTSGYAQKNIPIFYTSLYQDSVYIQFLYAPASVYISVCLRTRDVYGQKHGVICFWYGLPPYLLFHAEWILWA